MPTVECTYLLNVRQSRFAWVRQSSQMAGVRVGHVGQLYLKKRKRNISSSLNHFSVRFDDFVLLLLLYHCYIPFYDIINFYVLLHAIIYYNNLLHAITCYYIIFYNVIYCYLLLYTIIYSMLFYITIIYYILWYTTKIYFIWPCCCYCYCYCCYNWHCDGRKAIYTQSTPRRSQVLHSASAS